MGLFDLPLEIIEEIMIFSDPVEVASLAQCCRFLRGLVYSEGSADDHGQGEGSEQAEKISSNNILWKALYLQQPLDDPRTCVTPLGVSRRKVGIDWRGELQRFIRARNVLRQPGSYEKRDVTKALKTVVFLVENVPPLTVIDIKAPDGRTFREVEPSSLNLAWVAARLRGSPLLDEDRVEEQEAGGSDGVAVNGFRVGNVGKAANRERDEQVQLRARLHTYFGITQRDLLPSTRVDSRAYVYDVRHYNWANEFGPFDEDGNVNWVHVQKLHHVVSMQIINPDIGLGGMFLTYPLSLPFTQPDIPEDIDLDQTEDWAGVTGIWEVSFCFCDHRDLMEYNSTAQHGEPLDKSLFERPDFVEVFRSLVVQVRVTRTLDDHDHPNRPAIYFVGVMSEPSTSTMSGKVQMTKDGQVQWHFVSGEAGNAIWSSEGVQIGGIRSQYGVLGAWTTIFHDRDDPVGPFWLRKVGELPQQNTSST
ncbi:hypothetical protein AX16_004617 [Volvariella volvacea WC 439]|nr:hypothetical protein AX16_004617 [Volvariella volvacea WC 439]